MTYTSLLPNIFAFFSIIYLMVYAGASAYNKPHQQYQRGLYKFYENNKKETKSIPY
jgi:hypothetical protein